MINLQESRIKKGSSRISGTSCPGSAVNPFSLISVPADSSLAPAQIDSFGEEIMAFQVYSCDSTGGCINGGADYLIISRPGFCISPNIPIFAAPKGNRERLQADGL